ncbi:MULTISPECIES: nicotinate-nucleotide adenylyltransferase [unclassified Carboxydocella]|uniref:nicotinate-nucleotide adenylyltransferase n=1 Tax=unclassified Carboxydocella TaxID=2685367 RepID=UPI0009ACD114|nr:MULTISPECIES: nicotinate-nucleotide adenylyltransferase [unclassified Carboxydocella]AVX30394.1 nicotinate-nucleotide adenylyltransferase [Carboxydocella thermautotrophica]GAW28027.1 nicotinate-nicotinamide nucleotide adenylyltransferase [Carboxydocella sp. ULO1]GAW32345.1 nicotinate-nicotinamide nucleotide adenylyltransferase [Carboxydocella sp. JDF658]
MDKRVAVMGGTFDPIHLGHLVVAQEVADELGLDRVLFVPSGQPPHKQGAKVTAAELRAEMVRLAIADNPRFQLCLLELERPGPSYTYDTVRQLLDQGNYQELYFITGADAVLEILTWHRVRELLALCHFIAVTRPGFELEQLREVQGRLGTQLGQRIRPFTVPSLAISSSDIRARVARGKSIKYLVHPEVEKFIVNNNLYRF